jgi:glycosyltransferase involved in cell wall biosynthesis
MATTRKVLGFVSPMRAYTHEGRVYTHVASGRVVDGLAVHYDKVLLCTRVVRGAPPSSSDLPLDAHNVELRDQPFWANTIGSIPHVVGISRAYYGTCRDADLIFVRGMCPYIGVLYAFAYWFRVPVCHWIVGDPVALLRAGGRGGGLTNLLSLAYAWQDRIASRVGRWLTRGAFICNGQPLADAYASPRTFATVSSTVTNDEFFLRADTCEQAVVRILFVGYIRQEKGVEYLLEALPRLRTARPWELEIVGPDEGLAYRKRLDAVVQEQGLADRVRFVGYVAYGEPMLHRLRAADMLVLPSLSEGTPHVLVEARANGLPCISTTVGGIPSTVTDGVDAVLVPSRDSTALAKAIDRVIEDGEFRRRLIRNGLASARHQTLEAFVALAHRELEGDDRPTMARMAQPTGRS